MILNVPVALTLMRFLLIPVFVAIFYMPTLWSAIASAFVFFLAACTDVLDGYLARVLNQSTRFGAFLDPVADKVMVATALVLLASDYATWYFALPAVVLIVREIIISALREWMAEIGKGQVIAVSWVGKLKTVVQMSAIIAFLWHQSPWMVEFAYVLIYVAMLLSLVSMLAYIRDAWPDLNQA
ncbi:MAG: CDP-diacylglycerol--glycerol-3-phosphate 3-phosphatidyltransferase [Shewanellaceae bacterium]|nr:CDP-diacylglycerol--glycerol-3-phosphate 3-phosphatidyltransferase [Shewanellaceae bacterium]